MQRTFGELLKQLRVAAGLSQGKLDKAIGKARGYVNQVETGRICPPEKAVCDQMDGPFGLEPGTVWKRAAPGRLQSRSKDGDLWTWHLEQLDGSGNEALNEAALMRALTAELRVRDLEARLAHMHDIEARLARVRDALEEPC